MSAHVLGTITFPVRVRYSLPAYTLVYENADSAMAFLSVCCLPLRQERPETVIGENAHMLCMFSTYWGGHTWESVLPLTVDWRDRMRDYARQYATTYVNYDYGQLELF